MLTLKVHIPQKNIKKKIAVTQNLSSRGSLAHMSGNILPHLYAYVQMCKDVLHKWEYAIKSHPFSLICTVLRTEKQV